MEFNLLILTICLALTFDFINGFHDAANSISTVVTTKVLSPLQAVAWAAFFNFSAYWVFGFTIADTIAKTADTMKLNMTTILSGVIAGITWDLITWKRGIPSSSSHTLVGGFAGAAIATAGWNSVNWFKPGVAGALPTGVFVILAFIVLAPVIGMFLSYLISVWMSHSSQKGIWPKFFTISIAAAMTYLISLNWVPIGSIKHPKIKENEILSMLIHESNLRWLIIGFLIYSLCFYFLTMSYKNIEQINKSFKKLQLLSSAAFSLGHGGNDAQKVMGIIAAAVLVYTNVTKQKVTSMPDWLKVVLPNKDVVAQIPSWLPFVCHLAIALGTLAGGWKIIKTMGTKITKVTSQEGVAAETAGALTLFFTEFYKVPVSSTHTITGAIIGTGLSKRLSSIRWGMSRKIIVAWIITIPISAIIAILVYNFLRLFIKY